MTKALTLHQPWASLVALGVKTIETRSWGTRYRGRLVIHAGLRKPEHGLVVGAHRVMHRPPTTARGQRVGEAWFLVDDEVGDRGVSPRLSFGAIVATCELMDVVPMLGTHQRDTFPYLHVDDALLVTGRTTGSDVTDELPYGDFRPGRYAWLLEDVQPTTKRCPGCWGEGTTTVVRTPPYDWGGLNVTQRPCDVCVGEGRCEPVSARGRQRLWEWTP